VRLRHSLIAVVLLILAATSAAAQPSRPPFVDDLVQGMEVTAQGCVKPGEGTGKWVFTQVMTWPIVRNQSGPHGPRHLAIRMPEPERLDEFIGDTVQLTGRIIYVQKSEIETEPGLRRFGRFIEFERPDGNVLVRPQVMGWRLDSRGGRGDISITLLDYQVEAMMRVMKGCLPLPGAGALTARRQ
jgi:hypothetical protein